MWSEFLNTYRNDKINPQNKSIEEFNNNGKYAHYTVDLYNKIKIDFLIKFAITYLYTFYI